MTRRFWSAALATALAGGVYLAGAAAQASNMGFKLERDFDVRRNTGTNRVLGNIYFVSFPYFNGLGDLADNSAIRSPASYCIGDPSGPTAGDGRITSDDAMCDWWTARTLGAAGGTFSLSFYDTNTCSIVSRQARFVLSSPQFSGTLFPATGDLRTDIGYQVNVGLASNHPVGSPDPRNRAVIVGSHDPSFTGHAITYTPTCGAGGPPCCNSSRAARLDLFAVPYHTMFSRSVEILCGLQGVDWPDANNDFVPDDLADASACDNGIFDTRHTIAVSAYRNDDPATGGTAGYVQQTARWLTVPAPGRVQLAPATPFDLIPGDAYQAAIDALHTPTNFLSPHF
jgi:hypothetical protein